MASLRGAQVTRFSVDDGAGASRNLLAYIDGEQDITFRAGPTLRRNTRGGDTASRYTDDAPHEYQLDIPLIPDDAANATIDAVLSGRRASPANGRNFNLEIRTGASSSTTGLKISGLCQVDEITMTYRNSEGTAGFLLPLRSFGTEWAVAVTGLATG